MVRIFCKNTGTFAEFTEGTTLLEMLDSFQFEKPWPILSAKVNNVSQGLKYRVFNNRDVEFLDYRTYSGRSVYSRSLCFVLGKAVKDVFPEYFIAVRRPISKGYYCSIYKPEDVTLTSEDVDRIRFRMQEIIDKNILFRRYDVQTPVAIKMFEDLGYTDKADLLRTSGDVYTNYYTLEDTPDYFYGALVPSTGYLKVWALEPYRDGMLLRIPDRHEPSRLAPFVIQPKTFDTFLESIEWNRIMGLSCVSDLNVACERGEARELIQISEALQEKKIVQIAEQISARFHSDNQIKVVLLTGPTSSGKTVICQKLSIQLKACGIKPLSFSTDDYFVDRIKTPRLPDGSFDFDNFETVDHKALEQDVLKLLNGEEVEVPEFNFVTGIREYNGKKLKLGDNNILLIEGIHALNPMLIPSVSADKQFKIFINTITSISLDNHNCIPTSDNRLLRRIVRDFNKGAFTAKQTISQWPNVRRAESEWIYPYQETADVLFNSAYLVEFAVLRPHAEQILETVPKNCPEYSEAKRLMDFLHYFTPVSDKEIPPTSLLNDFVGKR